MTHSNWSLLRATVSCALGAWLLVGCAVQQSRADLRERPNIIYILADDLGYGELGSYGQTRIRTPNLDRLAREGVRFTQHYSGSCVCAPSRCSLLTGRHTGTSQVRDNFEVGGFERGNQEGQLPLAAGTRTLGRLLQDVGYSTACVGKWGLGGPESTGHPLEQGFDHFFGYLCQRHAHNYYPEHLWRDRERVLYPGNTWQNVEGAHFACDPMIDSALDFIADNADRPFFLYFATPVPHVALQVPADSLAEYRDAWDDPPYDGKRGYLPHDTPRAAYAAMVTRMDRDIGRILALLDALGLADDTLVVFASDNGPTYAGGADSEFFASAGGLRGLKGTLYEGGIRVPMIVRWPARIEGGRTDDRPSAMWDILPTCAQIVGHKLPPHAVDGHSLLDQWTGAAASPGEAPRSLYWEHHAGGGWQAARIGDWKAVRRDIRKRPTARPELYDLASDPSEAHDVADQHPEMLARFAGLFASRTASPVERWNFATSADSARGAVSRTEPIVEIQHSGVTASLRALGVVSDLVVWASGSAGTVIRSDDAGVTWKEVGPAVARAAGLDLRCLHVFADGRRAIVANAGSPAHIYATDDGGQSWQQVFESQAPGVFFDGLDLFDEQRGVAFSDPFDGGFRLLGTEDGGRSWSWHDPTVLPSPLSGEAGFAASDSSLRAFGGDRIWIGTGGGARARVLTSSDGGASWSSVDTPLAAGSASRGIFALAVADADRAVAVGGDHADPDQAHGTAAFSADGGRTWRVAATPPHGYRSGVDVASLAGSQRTRARVWIAVGPNGCDVSSDDGANWTQLAGVAGFHAIRFAPSGRIAWSVGADGRVARWRFATP